MTAPNDGGPARPLRELIEQAQRLDAEATKGPWNADKWYGNDAGGFAAVGPHHIDNDRFEHEDECDCDCSDGCEPSCPHAEAADRDAAFIAASRSLLPELAGKAEEMVKMLRTLEIFTRCRCEPGWTDRDLHAPECIFDEVPELADWLRANGYAERSHGEER